MRFEQPVDNVVTRFPELRVHTRQGSVPHVSHAEIEAAIALGRRLHARQVRETLDGIIVQPLAAAGRAAARLVSRLAREYQRDRARRVTIRELSVLEDYQLRDIGIERDAIASVAEALVEEKYGVSSAAPAAQEPSRVEAPFEPLRAA